ncbi:hypothetical protein [Psychrobacter sp. JCM 18901]|uniref:hypothetical protein n=1 Tax=Psychrobacter sp. JCM 18901 TaxID=1298609 RepID=UPI0004B281B1|nr:hypothetical protein [Psychrobacter sp. JCM 18901]
MVSKSASDETNDTGKDIHTEVSNKSSGHVPSPEHTEGKNKKRKDRADSRASD